MGRPSKPYAEKARNAGVVLYPDEIAAIESATKALRMKTTSDFLRDAIITRDARQTRGKIMKPRRESRLSNLGRPLEPRSAPLTPAGTG